VLSKRPCCRRDRLGCRMQTALCCIANGIRVSLHSLSCSSLLPAPLEAHLGELLSLGIVAFLSPSQPSHTYFHHPCHPETQPWQHPSTLPTSSSPHPLVGCTPCTLFLKASSIPTLQVSTLQPLYKCLLLCSACTPVCTHK
jgi:hypothetical protein